MTLVVNLCCRQTPEFQALNGALIAYLSEITERLIKEEIYHDVSEPADTKAVITKNLSFDL